jgi:hypothetical protein
MKKCLLYQLFAATVAVFAATIGVYAQTAPNNADTAKIAVPPSQSPFGKLNVPSDMLNIGDSSLYFTSKFKLDINSITVYGQYGLYNKQLPNLRLLGYYNPKKEIPPFLYALLLVGAFFNHTVGTIPQEQYNNVMNNLYKTPLFSSSPSNTIPVIGSQGVFGNPDITVSGYKTYTPDVSKPANAVTGKTDDK